MTQHTTKLLLISVKVSPAHSRAQTKSQIFVFVEEGETRAFYDQDRRARFAAWRALLAPYLAEGTKLAFKQTCSCGCSPGLVVEQGRQFKTADGTLANVFIDAKAVRS